MARARTGTTVTNEWLDTHVRSKGPLGKVYPKFAFIMEGDTPSFLGLLDNGWFPYAEAGRTGTSLAAIRIAGADTAKAVVTASATCRPKWIPSAAACLGRGTAHVILAVTDEGSPRLTSYRRVVLNVR